MKKFTIVFYNTETLPLSGNDDAMLTPPSEFITFRGNKSELWFPKGNIKTIVIEDITPVKEEKEEVETNVD